MGVTARRFITNAGTDITACVTSPRVRRGRGLQPDRADRNSRGDEISKPMKKLGLAGRTRASSPSRTRPSSGNLLGPRQGSPVPRDPRRGRISVAADGCGARQGAYDLAYGYAQERRSSGSRSRSSRRLQFKLADMPGARGRANLVYKARGSRTRAARLRALAAGTGEALHGRALQPGVNWALQIHCGYGYMDRVPISRLYRDQKILWIGEGTNEVQRMVIAAALGL